MKVYLQLPARWVSVRRQTKSDASAVRYRRVKKRDTVEKEAEGISLKKEITMAFAREDGRWAAEQKAMQALVRKLEIEMEAADAQVRRRMRSRLNAMKPSSLERRPS